MKTLVITANLENEIKDIRALEAKIDELDELKKEKDFMVYSIFNRSFILTHIKHNEITLCINSQFMTDHVFWERNRFEIYIMNIFFFQSLPCI